MSGFCQKLIIPISLHSLVLDIDNEAIQQEDFSFLLLNFLKS